MADERPQAQDSSSPRFASVPLPGPVHIAEELGDLQTEPRSRIFVLSGVALAVVAGLVAMIGFALRPRPQAKGSIEEVYAVAVPGDAVLTTIKLNFNNTGEKPL